MSLLRLVEHEFRGAKACDVLLLGAETDKNISVNNGSLRQL